VGLERDPSMKPIFFFQLKSSGDYASPKIKFVTTQKRRNKILTWMITMMK